MATGRWRVTMPVLAGALLGLSVAAPFGPVSLVCAQRSIAMGRACGIISGLGAASAHGLFALIAVAGAQVVAPALTHWHAPIQVASALLLAGLGLRTLLRRPAAGQPVPIRAPAAYASSFLLALSNPMTILPYAAVASSGAMSGAELPFSGWSVPGVMAGAALWYAALSATMAVFRTALSPHVTRYLNRAAGGVLIAIAVLVALR